MSEGRIFAIGDIHGYLNKLRALMSKISPDPERDQLVFLGDYVDRGPQSREVVDYILELQWLYPNTVCLMGNHEQMFLEYLANPRDPWTFLINGGVETIHSYELTGDDPVSKLPQEHMDFLNGLKPYHDSDEYIFVHAGLRVGVPLQEQTLDDLIWIRSEFIDSPHDFGRRVIFGHTPFARPLIHPNKIGIDTGAGYGGKLTGLVLPDLTFHSTDGALPHGL
jgi:serine/threonine protein phosphatase 1